MVPVLEMVQEMVQEMVLEKEMVLVEILNLNYKIML